MHFRNNRPAKEGDPAIGETYKGSKVFRAGTLHTLQPGCTSCNAQLAVPIPGGVTNYCVTIGDLYHAEDAFGAMEEKQPPEKVA